MPTAEARDVLPDPVARAEAVFNLGHAAQTAIALTQDPSLLFEAIRDRLHQDVRLTLVPEAREMFERVRGLGLPVCVSGAGPSLLAFEIDARTVPDDLGEGWKVLRPGVRASGFEVSVDEQA
jgi:homoserine kinase